MGAGAGRLAVIAAITTGAGAILCAQGAWKLLRAIRARFTYGAPYKRGMVQERLLTVLMEIVVLLVGAALGFLALGQAAFQPQGTTVRVGQVEAHRSGWGRVKVRIVPDPLYPGSRVLEGEVSGARWAIAGDFISWDPGVKWLGFMDGQRVRYLLGTPDTTGLSPSEKGETVVLDTLPGAGFRLIATAPYIPFLRVRREATPWFPLAERQVMTLYAAGPGYLADVAAESTRGASRAEASPLSGGGPHRVTAPVGFAAAPDRPSRAPRLEGPAPRRGPPSAPGDDSVCPPGSRLASSPNQGGIQPPAATTGGGAQRRRTRARRTQDVTSQAGDTSASRDIDSAARPR